MGGWELGDVGEMRSCEVGEVGRNKRKRNRESKNYGK